MTDHARLQDRHRRGGVLRIAPQRGVAAGDDEAAPAGQRRLVHPALDAVRILHQPPDLELAQDLHRQVAALVDPLDRIARAGAGAQVHLVGAQRDEARQRQAGGGTLGGVGFRLAWAVRPGTGGGGAPAAGAGSPAELGRAAASARAARHAAAPPAWLPGSTCCTGSRGAVLIGVGGGFSALLLWRQLQRAGRRIVGGLRQACGEVASRSRTAVGKPTRRRSNGHGSWLPSRGEPGQARTVQGFALKPTRGVCPWTPTKGVAFEILVIGTGRRVLQARSLIDDGGQIRDRQGR